MLVDRGPQQVAHQWGCDGPWLQTHVGLVLGPRSGVRGRNGVGLLGNEPASGTWQINQPLGDSWPWSLCGNKDAPPGNQLGGDVHRRIPGLETDLGYRPGSVPTLLGILRKIS